jgi:hypothetical protein
MSAYQHIRGLLEAPTELLLGRQFDDDGILRLKFGISFVLGIPRIKLTICRPRADVRRNSKLVNFDEQLFIP